MKSLINKSKKNLLAVLSKCPLTGRCKTRIAAESNFDFAKEFSIACLDDLLEKIKNNKYFDVVVVTDSIEDANWFQGRYSLPALAISKSLENYNFGDVISFIFNLYLNEKKFQNVLITPMDMPYMGEEDFISIFEQLNQNKYIISPKSSGGVNFIGANEWSTSQNRLNSVRWSTTKSFSDLSKILRKSNIKTINNFRDINTVKDIVELREIISKTCKRTNDLLYSKKYMHLFSLGSD